MSYKRTAAAAPVSGVEFKENVEGRLGKGSVCSCWTRNFTVCSWRTRCCCRYLELHAIFIFLKSNCIMIFKFSSYLLRYIFRNIWLLCLWCLLLLISFMIALLMVPSFTHQFYDCLVYDAYFYSLVLWLLCLWYLLLLISFMIAFLWCLY